MLYDFIDEQIDTTTPRHSGPDGCFAPVCHDHKSIPSRTADYYSLAAIFANTKAFFENRHGRRVRYLLRAARSGRRGAPLGGAAGEAGQHTPARINAILDAETERHQAPLRPHIAEYICLATRHPEMSAGLDPLVFARWAKFLKPDKESESPF